MKIFYTLLLLLLALSLLLFPSAALANTKEGLIYFGLNMVPALFPFMVLTNLFIQLDLSGTLTKLLHPLFSFLFGTSEEEDFCILTGFLCGFPLGALTIVSQIKSGKISSKRGNLLLAFTSLPGPVYIASLVLPLFSTMQHRLLFLLLFYGIPVLTGVVLSRIHNNKKKNKNKNNNKNNMQRIHSPYEKTIHPTPSTSAHPMPSFPVAFEQALNTSLKSILTLGGIVIIFYTLKMYFRFIPDSFMPLKIAGSFLLEINGGIAILTQNKELLTCKELLSFLSLFPLCGLSCLMQIACVIQGSGLKIKYYILPKLIHCLLWFLSIRLLPFTH